MRQDVNLHQPMFRKQRALFSARVSLRIGVIILGALVLVYAVTLARTQIQVAEYNRLQQQRESAQRRLEEAARQLSGSGGRTEALSAEVARLNEEFSRKSGTLHVLSRGELGDTTGFSGHFTGLARQRLQGLWLTRIEVSAGGEQLILEGNTVAEELIPRYLQLLSREPQFKGVQFQEAELKREAGEAGTLRFALRTALSGGRRRS